ncbi:MAG: hypothetical protein A3D31_04170 [Candidatus Fluviicola riflensis]|nr:MAG: hypothetical protein CHH17_10860 [Candidatus Fluviicola riflensis]OGS79172.1 MAG: hypothetical protein A3D31_04170 [Candidatus Fluviicola riflensis]OGS86604.1 MAG: hypothetical protein A2724_03630 [Fluviicola sp. RIFCSPHIGHO2_01_FULL_43_53]OGS88922.1 MAG: hypothetical protein A3E30_01030 [Fluviicola sp. RIFCSPHIGHO2_12_FULL_43_24]
MTSTKTMSSFGKLLLAILLCEVTGVASAIISNSGIRLWLERYDQSSWIPNEYLLSNVWMVLYMLMGIALWLIWKNHSSRKKRNSAIRLFVIQLILNFWSSLLLLSFHSPILMVINILVLLTLLILIANRFSEFSKTAALLLMPYIAWIGFASVLNLQIWMAQ